jgi:hypothetical protein
VGRERKEEQKMEGVGGRGAGDGEEGGRERKGERERQEERERVKYRERNARMKGS